MLIFKQKVSSKEIIGAVVSVLWRCTFLHIVVRSLINRVDI